MDFNINLKRLERVNKLIKRRQTGNPETFSRQLNISKATLFRYLKIMKALGAPVEYDKLRETYYYVKPGELQMRFTDTSHEPVLYEDPQFFFSDS
jgi:predicted DNA-binding transcriptional regulator YafY